MNPTPPIQSVHLAVAVSAISKTKQVGEYTEQDYQVLKIMLILITQCFGLNTVFGQNEWNFMKYVVGLQNQGAHFSHQKAGTSTLRNWDGRLPFNTYSLNFIHRGLHIRSV